MMMILSVIALECIHFIIGIIIFMATEIFPSDTADIKKWKVLLIGGPFMLIPRLIIKLKAADFNYSLKEWIEK